MALAQLPVVFLFSSKNSLLTFLSSAFSASGSFYEEANPSLRGQNLFTKSDPASLANMDKQIYRIIGKAATFAA